MSKPSRPAPRAERRDHELTVHAITRNDPYHWLRDDDWQRVMREPEVLKADIREYLEAENRYTEEALEGTRELQETLFQELKGRIREDESTIPAKDGPWDYYSRFEHGGQHPLLCRRPTREVEGPEAPEEEVRRGEEILYDADAASKAHGYFNVGGLSHCPRHVHLAVALDTKGSEYYEVTFLDLQTGALLDDRLENTNGGVVFSADGRVALYTLMDENHRPSKVYRHRLGTPQSDDVLVYEEEDPGFFVSVGSTEDRAHIVITSHDHTTTEARVIDASTVDQPPRLIAPRRPGLEYDLCALGGELLLMTNHEAEDFRLMVAPLAGAEPEQWRELVPHRPGCLLVAVTTFAQHIVRLEREGGLPRIVVRRRSDGNEHAIEFDEEAYSLGLSPGYEYETGKLRFTYSSLTTPPRTYEYDMETRQRRLLKQRQIPSGHDPARYRSRRLMAKSHDGELVPISLLWHEDTRISASTPVLLYGYGSYGHSMVAGFSSNCLSLVGRGFVYAMAHVRGGKDKGYAWYENGKLLKKKNTFLDFVAAAEHLCAAGYTSPGKITIHGGSAGGMLVGATANMRPDLLCAVVGEVPFVDVLSTMCDEELPLTPPEWPEWGNPLESLEAYEYIASYSPYDNVEAKAYPHILATAGLTDPRVTYWEPAKWVARLRELKTDDNLLLLKTYMEAGHGGSAGRFEKLREVALVYAFVLLAHECLEAAVLPPA